MQEETEKEIEVIYSEFESKLEALRKDQNSVISSFLEKLKERRISTLKTEIGGSSEK